jgi:hypothetical protein
MNITIKRIIHIKGISLQKTKINVCDYNNIIFMEYILCFLGFIDKGLEFTAPNFSIQRRFAPITLFIQS